MSIVKCQWVVDNQTFSRAVYRTIVSSNLRLYRESIGFRNLVIGFHGTLWRDCTGSLFGTPLVYSSKSVITTLNGIVVTSTSTDSNRIYLKLAWMVTFSSDAARSTFLAAWDIRARKFTSIRRTIARAELDFYLFQSAK